MLTEREIIDNKEEFEALIRSINRPQMNTEGLLKKLEDSDFFTAPASARYHAAYAGGLCKHSLNVYCNLKLLIENKYKDGTCPFSEDSIKIVALLHDISKMNLYEKTSRNIKVYSEQGSKTDELGRYDWQAEVSYKKKEDSQQFIFGTHGENSQYILSYFIPLYVEEAAAIINHHSNYDNPNLNVTAIYNRYSLACLLHIADMLATYVDERI